ncbi:MAG: lyase family protein [Candidatus Paceibacterota bacterium]
MDKRYMVPDITHLWSLEQRLLGWQETEIACIRADQHLGNISPEIADAMVQVLEANPIDISVYEANDKELRHDLNAFLQERERFLPKEYHKYFHREMTSYDTQEPAMARRLQASAALVAAGLERLDQVLLAQAEKYRYSPMVGRTHGQWAELQTFGFRCLRYRAVLKLCQAQLEFAQSFLDYSKISGAIANYTGRTMEEEWVALDLLNLRPFYGASQIMPRIIYLPLIGAMRAAGELLGQIALDVRLNARSGCPIMQEFFSPKQMGSSAMPHKRNPIQTEGAAGILTLLFGYLGSLEDVIQTWEERAIEQSSTERVAWPDAFHALIYCLGRIASVLEKEYVYTDNMLLEIKNMGGCYATSRVKTLLKNLGVAYGLAGEEAYRIVQLAAFNVIPVPDPYLPPAQSLEEAEERLQALMAEPREGQPLHLRDVLMQGALQPSAFLETSAEDLERWNAILKKMFSFPAPQEALREAFLLKSHLKGEEGVFKALLAS